MNSTEKAKEVIEHNRYMTVATSNGEGKPWISTVFFVYDALFNLYWVSDKKALHSRNIKANNHIAIVIFGPTPEDPAIDGVYFDAEAKELEDETEILSAMEVFKTRSQIDKFTITTLSDVTESAAWRIYKAVHTEISKRNDSIDPESGQAVTTRESISL